MVGNRAPVVPGPPEDIGRGIDFAMELVPEPRKTITLEIYREGRDTGEVAKEHGVTEKGCQKLIEKALSRIRRPDVPPYILQGYDALPELCRWSKREIAVRPGAGEISATQLDELLKGGP